MFFIVCSEARISAISATPLPPPPVFFRYFKRYRQVTGTTDDTLRRGRLPSGGLAQGNLELGEELRAFFSRGESRIC